MGTSACRFAPKWGRSQKCEHEIVLLYGGYDHDCELLHSQLANLTLRSRCIDFDAPEEPNAFF